VSLISNAKHKKQKSQMEGMAWDFQISAITLIRRRAYYISSTTNKKGQKTHERVHDSSRRFQEQNREVLGFSQVSSFQKV
jgi:hypothetical protein